MPVNKKNVWVIVMDGGQAKIFSGLKNNLKFLLERSHTHESTHEHGHDKPGRSFESKSDVRHAYEPRTDWHDHQKEVFVHEICQLIQDAYQQHSFEVLYLVCPPKILGLMRPHLAFIDKNTKIYEVEKDLIHHTTLDIHNALQDVF